MKQKQDERRYGSPVVAGTVACVDYMSLSSLPIGQKAVKFPHFKGLMVAMQRGACLSTILLHPGNTCHD